MFELTITREVACSLEVGVWNYWDIEHAPIVHAGHVANEILAQGPGFVLVLVTVKLPILRFLKSSSFHFMFRLAPNRFAAYSTFFGAPSVTTYEIVELRKDYSAFRMTYRFQLNGWRILFRPFMGPIIRRWNEAVWNEDLPLKLRRQQVLDCGFRDFEGLPSRVEERMERTDYHCAIPPARPADSPVDAHPFRARAL